MIQVQRGFLSIRLYKEHFWDLYFALQKKTKKKQESVVMSPKTIQLYIEHQLLFYFYQ